MKNYGEHQLLLLTITQLGNDWEHNETAASIRNDESKLGTLLAIGNSLHGAEPVLNVAELYAHAPAFCAMYQTVTLRKIEERTNDGNPDPD